MILLSVIITVLYFVLITSFILGFNRIDTFKLNNEPAKNTFSVIIPFRNESKNLPSLLKSIASLKYSKELFEIIFVDDSSEDNSVNIIQKFIENQSKKNVTNIKIVSNERKTNSPKKDAITTAIKQAKHNWISTTDADCILPKYWLNAFDDFIQKTEAVCIAAPVTYHKPSNFLGQFQLLDILSLQGATIGGFAIKKPFLCNGANFTYKKEIFNQLKGFNGNTNIASGDDIFLLEKIVSNYPKKAHYLKCEQAIVTTSQQHTWKELIAQRVRWAAKTSAYNNWFGKLTGLIILTKNLLIISSLFLFILGFFNLNTLLYIIAIKFSVDFFLIFKSATFFKQKYILKTFILGFFVYSFFCVYIAIVSNFISFKWKERTFKK